jgi:hypothetical protein
MGQERKCEKENEKGEEEEEGGENPLFQEDRPIED